MMDNLLGWWMWPLGFAFAGVMILLAIAAFVFWIWMLVDCAKRRFLNKTEKILWLVIIVLAGLMGSIIYLIVVKIYNPKGLNIK